MKYINKNKHEREFLEQKYYKNEEKRINENKKIIKEEAPKETSIALAKKENILQKIINKIKKFFSK